MWASGARSPEEPREPFWGTTGVTPRFNISTSICTRTGRTPETPSHRALARRSIMPRTTSAA